jgi:hypothetical protein
MNDVTESALRHYCPDNCTDWASMPSPQLIYDQQQLTNPLASTCLHEQRPSPSKVRQGDPPSSSLCMLSCWSLQEQSVSTCARQQYLVIAAQRRYAADPDQPAPQFQVETLCGCPRNSKKTLQQVVRLSPRYAGPFTVPLTVGKRAYTLSRLVQPACTTPSTSAESPPAD